MSVSRREAASIIRRAVKRVPEGESITHLNIMPMMDMMTILLVAFIQFLSAESKYAKEIAKAPKSVSVVQNKGEGARAIIISDSAILVDTSRIVGHKNGILDGKHFKDNNAKAFVIEPLKRVLEDLRKLAEKERLKNAAGGKVSKMFKVMIIAYKDIPFELLYKVTYSAQAAGYKQLRLMLSTRSKDPPKVPQDAKK